MNPLFETAAPFVIKVYDNYFQISWDGQSNKSEDNYFFEKLKSVEFKKGKITPKRIGLSFLLNSLVKTHNTNWNESDELVIKFNTGEVETRYFNKNTRDEHLEAIDLINRKLH